MQLSFYIDNFLHMACERTFLKIAEYLLTDCHINPNAKDNSQQSPLSLAKSKEVMKLLLQHGAHAEDVYTQHRKTLGNVFSKDPLKSPVKMFVIGHGGEGKSTLIEALEHEPTFWTSLVNIFIRPKEVKGVDKRTAGIIPRVFKSRFHGDILFYDFAGQEAYYSSHAAVIKSSVDSCPPIFLLVIGLHRDHTAITNSVSYWLGIITNQCGNMEGKAPLIVVGSHADLVETGVADRKKQIISQAVEKYIAFDLISVISMDCRYSNSDGMKVLRGFVGTSCNLLQSKLTVSLNCHMFLIYLINKHPSDIAITLERVQAELQEEIDTPGSERKQYTKHKREICFIPTTIPRLAEICVQLSDKGHILFLPNESSPEKSFVIIDKSALLAKINGTMFAPEDFEQHCKLATSTGVVPQYKLAQEFPDFNIAMLNSFLSHLELAVPIEDKEVLQLIHKHLSSSSEFSASLDQKYLFCPALIRLDVPSRVFEYQTDRLYHFGWILSAVQQEHFLDARFLHVLLLRLALSLGLAPVVDHTVPALQYQCSVWKTGVYWNTRQGTDILVEVVDKKKVVVYIQAKYLSFSLFQVQSTVLQKVRGAVSELCPTVFTEEFLISPSDMKYPLTLSSSTPLFSMKSVAQSIVHIDPCIVSVDGTVSMDVSKYEVYAYLGEKMIRTLFTSKDVIDDQFFSTLYSQWSKSPQVVDIVSSAVIKAYKAEPTTHSSTEDFIAILKSWRDGSDGTYRSLRHILDQLSVFAGNNPLVSCDPFTVCV